MRQSFRIPAMIALGLFAVLAAAAAFSSPEVSFRSAERDGARVAEVLIGERPVIVVRTSAGGYSPLERAEIVANRLRSALATEVAPDDVTVSSIPSGAGLGIRGELIVAVYQPEADAHGATPTALARLWRDNLLLALGHEVVEPQPEQPAAAEDEPAEPAAPAPGETTAEASSQAPAADAVDWTGSAQKWVPVFSLETEGARIGMAQIAGSTAQVDRVKGVYELRLDFERIGRIYAYIPVGTLSITKLDRVQGVSVWALADIKVLGF
jgi:hypothetical protein